jgi:putative DNA methylase
LNRDIASGAIPLHQALGRERLTDVLKSRATAASQGDAAQIIHSKLGVTLRSVATDPPYFHNIGYADLSHFFYVWLRKSLRPM